MQASGLAEMALEVLRQVERLDPGRKLTITDIAYRIYGDKWEKELEIELQKRVMNKFEQRGTVEVTLDPDSGRKTYRLGVPLEAATDPGLTRL
jgi:hypothetical protein